MRLKDLINLSAELANNSDFAYGGVKESITRELMAEVQRTICKERRWSWLLKTTTFNTVAGQEEYLLPRDLREIYTIIEGNTPNKLTYIGQDDFDVLRPLTTERGIPTHYRLFGRRNDVYNIGIVSIASGSRIPMPTTKETAWTIQNNIYPHQRITFDDSKEVYTISSVTPITAKNWTVGFTNNNDWRSVIYANNLFVAVASSFGVDSNIMVSNDGVTWAIRNNVGSWEGITYGNNLFVAVGSTGAIYSSDTITWLYGDTPAGYTWRSVTYGNGLFVAVAYVGPTWDRVMTSPDGINWTLRTNIPMGSWTSITYGNNLFVAVGESGANRIMTSPDGINWTARSTPVNNNWRSVTYGNGLFVAVANGFDDPNNADKAVMTSPDGINWTIQPTPVSLQNATWWEVTYGGGLFVAVGSSVSPQVMTSLDGINWTIHPIGINNDWQSVTYGKNRFIAVSSTGSNNRAMVSETVYPITLHEKVVTPVIDSTYSIKIDNQVIRFYPIPERPITMTLKYFQNVLDLRDDEDESIIPDDTILAYGTAMLIKAKNEEDATWLSDMYQKMLREMRKQDEERFDHLDQFSPPVRQFQNQWNPFVI